MANKYKTSMSSRVTGKIWRLGRRNRRRVPRSTERAPPRDEERKRHGIGDPQTAPISGDKKPGSRRDSDMVVQYAHDPY